jgi:hypothetical protein
MLLMFINMFEATLAVRHPCWLVVDGGLVICLITSWEI